MIQPVKTISGCLAALDVPQVVVRHAPLRLLKLGMATGLDESAGVKSLVKSRPPGRPGPQMMLKSPINGGDEDDAR